MTDSLLSKLAATRRKELFTAAATALVLSFAFVLVALGVTMLIDWLVVLPRLARVMLLVFDLAVAGRIVFKGAILAMLAPASDQTLALIVEKFEPRFEGRLISSVELSREGAIGVGESRSLVQAMIGQAVEIAQTVDFRAAVDDRMLARRVKSAGLLLLIACGAFAASWPASRALLQRALAGSVDVPRWTRIIPVTHEQAVAIGDDFTIEVIAQGRKPKAGKVVLRYDSGIVQETTLNPALDHEGHYTAAINNIQEPFSYQVSLGDSQGSRYRITAMPRPSVSNLKCWQVFPVYTQLPPRARMPGDLTTLLRGSRLILSVQASKPLKVTTASDQPKNLIHLNGPEKGDIPLVVHPAPVATFDHAPADAATLPEGIALPDNTTGLSVLLVDTNGIPSKEAATYPIALVGKNKPVVKILSPADSEVLALPTDTLAIRYTAHDDYAIGSLSLHYKVESDPQEHVVSIPLQGRPAQAEGSYQLSVASINRPVAETGAGVSCECWLAVTDTDNISSPDHVSNVGESQHFELRIVTQEEIDAHLHELQQQAIGAIKNLRQEQQKTSDDLMHGIIGTPATQPAGNP